LIRRGGARERLIRAPQRTDQVRYNQTCAHIKVHAFQASPEYGSEIPEKQCSCHHTEIKEQSLEKDLSSTAENYFHK
jgi:hypothetical protein